MTDRDPPPFRLLADSELDEDGADRGSEQAPVDRTDLGRTGFGRRTRILAVLAAGSLIAAGVAVQAHRAHQAGTHARAVAQAREASRAATPAPVSTGRAAPAPPWPVAAAGPCGGPGVLLPVAATKSLTEHTGIRVTLGNFGLRTVDLDRGTVSQQPRFVLRDGSLVMAARTLGATTWAVVNSCSGGLRVIRYSTGRPAVNLPEDVALATLLGDDSDGVWMSSFGSGTTLAESKLQSTLVRLDRPETVLLPANTFPLALHGNVVVAETVNGPSRLLLFDRATRRIIRDLGPMASVTVSQDTVVWTSAACSAASPCALHRYDVRTAAISSRSYSLPVEAIVTGGVLSPDLRRFAFQLPRMTSDPRYSTAIPGTPSDLVVLDLASGVLEPVPNLELPPSSLAGITFSPDSRWLVIGASGPDGPRLLAWRSGLSNPLASPAKLPGPVPDPVPFLSYPNRSVGAVGAVDPGAPLPAPSG